MRRTRLGFCRARMGHLGDCHSVRPSGSVYTLGEGEDEDMADEKEGNIEESKSDKSVIIAKEEEEKEEEARSIRGKKPIRQPSRHEEAYAIQKMVSSLCERQENE